MARYSLVPSMLTYSVLYPSANLVQQKCFRDSQEIDWQEVGRFLVYGGLCHAPLVYNWLRLAARLFPKDTLGHLAAKVAMDQTMFAPVSRRDEETKTVRPDPRLQVGLSCFYVGLSTLEGKGREAVFAEWREKFPNTWAVSHRMCACQPSCRLRLLNFLFQISVFIWPMLQTINFKFVPAPYRPIYVGVFSFFWTTGLSGLKYSEKTPEMLKGFLT